MLLPDDIREPINPKCNPKDPTNAKVLNFMKANSAAAAQVASATGLTAKFILAWGAYESAYGTSKAAQNNNNFFGLTNGKWKEASPCGDGTSSAFVCFADLGLADSGISALTSFGERYLKAAAIAQAGNATIGGIAQAIADAGFNSEYESGGYGNNVDEAWNAIASRMNCP